MKYSQIGSDFTNEIVRECRGLIIDKYYNPVCIPFYKFGNYGENYVPDIDWSVAKVEEKIDGSLMKLWYYKNHWHISTNGTINAENAEIGTVNKFNLESSYKNFKDLFVKAMLDAELYTQNLNKNYTYMFELVSPYNRVVVPHEKIKIYHIGTRDNNTLQELEIDIGVEKPKIYDCNNLDDLVEMASKLRYCEEGYVVKDKSYNRIKVKSPAYVAVHHVISGMNENKLIELIRKNETEEFITYFPEYKNHIYELETKVSKWWCMMRSDIEGLDIKSCQTRKEFAERAKKTMCPQFMFLYYDGKFQCPRDWLWSLSNEKVIDQLNRIEV